MELSEIITQAKLKDNKVENATTNGVSEQELLDFSNESIFEVNDEPVIIEIPGLPGSYISIKRSVSYEVSAGRTRFAKQVQSLTRNSKGKRELGEQFVVDYDVFGLFVYKCRHCLADFKIIDPKTKKEARYNGVPGHTEAIFRGIKSEKLCQWISDKIDEVLGWGEEGEEAKSRFP